MINTVAQNSFCLAKHIITNPTTIQYSQLLNNEMKYTGITSLSSKLNSKMEMVYHRSKVNCKMFEGNYFNVINFNILLLLMAMAIVEFWFEF